MIRNHCYWLSGTIITIYFSLLIHSLASPPIHFCRNDQRDALLEFRNEFPLTKDEGDGTSSSKIRPGPGEAPTDKSNLIPWNESSDCCHWEGVACDDKHGQVISLEIFEMPLNSSLKSDSSLFKLQYLRRLNLSHCDLEGEIPSSIGNLSHLTLVDLTRTELIGEIPASVGNLNHLRYLSLRGNTLTGNIPSSIGNLSCLTNLDFAENNLVGEVPASIRNLNELRVMDLGQNSFSGNIPILLANLTKLTYFSIHSNNFTSTLPSDMSVFQNLQGFDVSYNSFFGPFPKSLFSIPSLSYVDLGGNQFTGPIEFGNTSSLSSEFQFLDVSSNRFYGQIPESISEFPNLNHVCLDHNDFNGPIPKSISKLVNLGLLYLHNNKLEGEVPAFIWGMERTLSHNLFSSLENSSQETGIYKLDLSSNSFRGPFPHWICKLKQILFLDFSNNFFNGSIPPCLRNSIVSLTELNLRNNSFSGVIPDMFDNATELRSFDVSRNQLEGKFPKSLINCKDLQLVNVESNKIKDNFPSWLGSLPSLQVLSLRSNEFYGPLYHRNLSIGFQSLRVIDVSHNDFTGTLPPHYFSDWREMTTVSVNIGASYILTYELNYMYSPTPESSIYRSTEMVYKGVEMRFDRISYYFRAIDFSGNRIYGKIPESIGFLKELRLLNLSGNVFTNDIPRILANLTNLETLDLSSNKLTGQIPQDLGKLYFMSYMNFSHNHLQGPIPRGTQFQRQNCSSFLDNPGLYGLEEICGERHVQNPTSQQPEKLSEAEEQMFNWVAAAIAYGPGVFCGLVIGYIFTSHNQEWFTEKFGPRKLRVTTSSR